MLTSRDAVPACVYILADHLDGVLAAGEDIVNAGLNWPEGSGGDPGVAGAQRWAITRMRAHEVSLVTHIVQARASAKTLAKGAHMFKASAHLFSSALVDFEDLAGADAENAANAFDAGTDSVVFLRERGLIAVDAAGALPREPLVIGDGYMIAGKMPMGVVLDLVSEFLDALDIAFELYPDANDAGAGENIVGHAA